MTLQLDLSISPKSFIETFLIILQKLLFLGIELFCTWLDYKCSKFGQRRLICRQFVSYLDCLSPLIVRYATVNYPWGILSNEPFPLVKLKVIVRVGALLLTSVCHNTGSHTSWLNTIFGNFDKILFDH